MFLANLISKMKQGTALGSRIASVHNGSSLFTGDAGQGESNFRRWIIENDWLEAIVALPLKMFYNTGIATYVWVISNRKEERRKGKVQLIDATDWFTPLRKNLGEKGVEISDADADRVLATYEASTRPTTPDHSKVFDGIDFGYSKITVERPLRIAGVEADRIYKAAEIKKLKEDGVRHEAAPPIIKKVLPYAATPRPVARAVRGDHRRAKPHSRVRARHRAARHRASATDRTSRRACDGIEAFFRREVEPYAPDAWIDETKTKIGYEISFTRHFYKPTPMRTLAEIQADIRALEAETDNLIAEIAGELMFRDLPRYPEMMVSQFWDATAPSHWEVHPGLAVLAENRRKNDGLIESQVLSLSFGRVVVKPVEKQRGLVPDSYEATRFSIRATSSYAPPLTFRTIRPAFA